MLLKAYPLIGSLASTSPLLSCATAPAGHAPRAKSLRQIPCSARRYAQHAAGESYPQSGSGEHEWPTCRHGTIPTPYEILKLTKGAPYSKVAFYELVKLYHPDRDIHNGEHIGRVPQQVRLERYRLIVAAHEVLSDPAKRRAYDRWGFGWDGQHHMPHQRSWSRSGSDNDHNFYRDNSSTAYNATWEDWERWYRSQDPKYKQQTRFTSNENFVGLIFLFIAVGASLELGRAAKFSNSFKEQVDAKHAAISQGLAQRRDLVNDLGGQDARVQKFLKVRESGYHDPEPLPSNNRPKSLPSPPSLTSGWK